MFLSKTTYNWFLIHLLSDRLIDYCLMSSEWVSDCCVKPNEQISAISLWEQVTFLLDDDDDVCLVLDKHA
jgi:hypothetical protein